MVIKDFQISLKNKCQNALKLLYNKVLSPFLLTIFYFYQTEKNLCFNFLNNYMFLVQKTNLKIAPEKSIFMLLEVNYLEHEVGYNTIKPIHLKIADFHQFPKFIDINFYQIY